MRWYLGAAALVLGVVWGRAFFEARDELARARATGDFRAQITHHQYAMRWYTPGAAAPMEAADALEVLAERAEADGRPEDALAAWRRLRGGALATRSLYSPFGDRVARANARIAALMADQQLARGDVTVRGRDRATLEADHLALLQIDRKPAAGWTLAVLLGFLGWVGGAFVLIRRGFDAQARVQRGPFLRWAAVTAGCFGVWILGLVNA